MAKFCMASSVIDPGSGSWVVAATLASGSKLHRTHDTQKLHRWAKSLLEPAHQPNATSEVPVLPPIAGTIEAHGDSEPKSAPASA